MTEASIAAVAARVHVRASWLAYGLIAVLPLALLAPWLGAVLDRDEGAYVVVALGMREGLVPYRDLFDHKPPLIYAVYWIAFLFDDGVWLVRLFAAFSLGVTGVLVVHVARALDSSWRASWVAGLAFALSVSNVHLQANANTEVFVLPAVTAALLLVARSLPGERGSLLTTAGALSGVALLCKTSAVFPAAALIAWLLIQRRPRDAAAFAAGGFIPVLACVALFAALDALPEFLYANITYNRFYTNAVPLSERLHVAVAFNQGVLLAGLGSWLVAGAGLVASVVAHTRGRTLLLIWAAGCWAAVSFTGRDHAHYYVQLLPAAALLGAVAFDAVRSQPRPLWVHAVVSTVLLSLFAWQALVYASAVSTPARRAEVHSLFPHLQSCETAAPGIGAWLAANSKPSDGVYNFGRDTSIYYYARHQPRVRFMYDRPFYLDPITSARTAAALSVDPPRYIIDTTAQCSENVAPPLEIPAVISQRYTLVATVETAAIYELRGQ